MIASRKEARLGLAEKGCGFMESGPSNHLCWHRIEDSLSAFRVFGYLERTALTL